MSYRDLPAEIDRLSERLRGLKQMIAALAKPKSQVVLSSPNRKLRASFELKDSGELVAFIFEQGTDGGYERIASVRRFNITLEKPVETGAFQ